MLVVDRIRNDYDEWFCDHFGVDVLKSIPEVEAAEVNLHDVNKYPVGCVKPSLLKTGAARGCDGNNRPFVAVVVDVTGENGYRYGTVTELVMKTYSNDGDGKSAVFKNHYTTFDGTNESGRCLSYLGGLWRTQPEQLQQIRDLVLGREVSARGFVLRMHNAEKKQMEEDFGKWFSEGIGADLLYKVPKVEAAAVNLQNPPEYPTGQVKPSMLKTAAVRGLTGDNRPFIALKIDVSKENGEKIGTITQLVLKRYSLDQGGRLPQYDNYYVSVVGNDEGNKAPHNYLGERITATQLQQIRALLSGNEVKSGGYSIKLAG